MVNVFVYSTERISISIYFQKRCTYISFAAHAHSICLFLLLLLNITWAHRINLLGQRLAQSIGCLDLSHFLFGSFFSEEGDKELTKISNKNQN